MQIDKLEIENFKLFAKQEFSFHPHFNLVIGENGSGKTSLLRALAVALAGWAHAYIKNKNNLRPIFDNERREIEIDGRFDVTKYQAIKAYGSGTIVDYIGNQKDMIAEWTRYRNEGISSTSIKGFQWFAPQYATSYPVNFNRIGSMILNSIEKGNNFNLPLIAFYECDRLWIATGQTTPELVATAKYSRFDPYIDCFHTGLNLHEVANWFLKHELASMQQGQETPFLYSIRYAAQMALDGCIGMRFDFEKSRVMVKFKDSSVPFEHLSDGQRNMVGLFCDIARRAAILNPHLGGNASAETKGVVLIDEIELHLHPAWQQNIVGNLKKAFPNIQFFATTHSPQIVSTVPSHQIMILDKDKVYQAEAGTQGAEASRILKRIFGVDSRPQNDPNTQLLNEYLDLVYKDKWNEAKEQRAKLDAIYQGNEPALTEADLYIENRQWEMEIEENQ